MPGKQPFYSRTTFGYVVVGLGITLVGAVVFTPLGNLVGKRLMDRFAPVERPASVHVPSTTPSTSDPVSSGSRVAQPATKSAGSPGTGLPSAIKTSAADGQRASLTLEYDSLRERYSAVNQSIQQRAGDLGDLPLKPEIGAALGGPRKPT